MNAPLATLNEEPPVIEIHNVVKEYRLGAFEGLRTLGRRLLGRSVPDQERFRALDDISLTIRRGEVVGIIGHNGAGKSTLLKLLCRITSPTNGTISVQGRIAPLIEVGAGLIGDMTGRENIFLNASILGVKRTDINEKVDEIIDFSELREFIDTPIKRYSSGMQVKLGFSIAVAAIADILIIDEVLAVGDVGFQRKSIKTIESFLRDKSKVALIVGHNIRQLERICTRVIVLDHGKLIFDGNPGRASKIYYSMLGRGNSVVQKSKTTKAIQINEFDLQSISVNDNQPSADSNLVVEADSCLEVSVNVICDVELLDCEINVGIHNSEMVFVKKSSTRMSSQRYDLRQGKNTIKAVFKKIGLSPGSYSLGLGVYDHMRRNIFTSTDLFWFDVDIADDDYPRFPKETLCYEDVFWSITNE